MRPSRKTLALLLLATLPVGAEGPPVDFEVVRERPGPIFRGVPVDLEIRAIDASGKLAAGFEGEVELTGVARRGEPIRRSGPFRKGLFELAKVEIPSGTVTVGRGEVLVERRWPVLPGFLTLLPPLLAISLAVLTRQVLIALFAGVWVGAWLLADLDPLAGLLRSADTYLVHSLADPDHASILLFSLSLAGLVGIVTATGGVRGIVEKVSRLAQSPRSGQVSTWFLGLLIFFDDYANSLIVGNAMRPFSDRVRVSREKLSFIVDATAAPIATVGVISTWTAYQLGLIADELPRLPATEQEPYLFFLRSIPSSFYSFLMIILVLLVALTLRDIGPMRRAEARARKTGAVLGRGARPLTDPALDRLGESPSLRPRWQNAAVPIALVVLFTLAGLYVTGREGLVEEGSEGGGLREVIARADAYRALLWAALGASVVAGVMGILQRFPVAEIVESWVSGARSLVLAAMILVLAWSIGAVTRDLGTGDYVVSVTKGLLSPSFLPSLAFLTAGVIAFSTGTSYGTMAILVPILLPLAYTLSGEDGLDASLTERIGLATLAAVLGGSVFGDHCSPISDTTVLSSMACGADHIDHVRTQLPYALLAAGVSVPCYILVGLGGSPLWVLPLGALGLVALFFLVARRE